MGKKEYGDAKKILHELINGDYPKYTEKDFEWANAEVLKRQGFDIGDSIVNLIPFYIDLLSIALSENHYDEADEYLKKLRELDKKFELNTSVSEAKILLGKGKTKPALKLLQEAERKNPSSVIWYEIGKIQRKLYDLPKARQAFENAIKLEVDNAKFHQALAETLIRLEDYESAVDHALTSIELIKYFPDAHYNLGEALEKLGDLENATKAYEMASKLRPKASSRAEIAIENIQERMDQIDKTDYKYRKDQIVIVSGLPRSGTSLMMQMISAGGIQVLTDSKREADISNPRGYYNLGFICFGIGTI